MLYEVITQNGLHMQQAQVKHLGTDSNYATMLKVIESISDKCEIKTNTEVIGVDKDNKVITFKTKDTTDSVIAEKIVFAVGRAGSKFLQKWCKENKIELSNNQVDVGVRVELPAIIWEDFAKRIYEPKIWYSSEQYGDMTRMFCFNDRGSVVTENTDGVITVNRNNFV